MNARLAGDFGGRKALQKCDEKFTTKVWQNVRWQLTVLAIQGRVFGRGSLTKTS